MPFHLSHFPLTNYTIYWYKNNHRISKKLFGQDDTLSLKQTPLNLFSMTKEIRVDGLNINL